MDDLPPELLQKIAYEMGVLSYEDVCAWSETCTRMADCLTRGRFARDLLASLRGPAACVSAGNARAARLAWKRLALPHAGDPTTSVPEPNPVADPVVADIILASASALLVRPLPVASPAPAPANVPELYRLQQDVAAGVRGCCAAQLGREFFTGSLSRQAEQTLWTRVGRRSKLGKRRRLLWRVQAAVLCGWVELVDAMLGGLLPADTGAATSTTSWEHILKAALMAGSLYNRPRCLAKVLAAAVAGRVQLNWLPFDAAAKWGAIDAMAVLVEAIPVLPDQALDRAASAAAEHGHLDVLRMVLAAGARPDYNHSYGLGLAARHGFLPIVEELLAAGANPAHDTAYALCHAVRNGHIDVVAALVPHPDLVIDEIPFLIPCLDSLAASDRTAAAAAAALLRPLTFEPDYWWSLPPSNP